MTAKAIINNWLLESKQDLIANYDALGLRASGEWADSLQEFQDKTSEGVRIGMLGQRYTGAIESGRSPNTDQSPEALKAWVGWAGNTIIEQWVNDKGLDLNPFAVAWKIALRGWHVPNGYNEGGLVSDVITKERLDKLNRQLALFYIDGFKSDFINELGNGNN